MSKNSTRRFMRILLANILITPTPTDLILVSPKFSWRGAEARCVELPRLVVIRPKRSFLARQNWYMIEITTENSLAELAILPSVKNLIMPQSVYLLADNHLVTLISDQGESKESLDLKFNSVESLRISREINAHPRTRPRKICSLDHRDSLEDLRGYLTNKTQRLSLHCNTSKMSVDDIEHLTSDLTLK